MAEDFYRYYRTERPMTFPHPKNNMPVAFLNYYELRDVEGGTVRAWGELWYSRPLSHRMIEKYGLCPSANNPKLDRAAPKPRITAQMEAAGKLAQAHRETLEQQKAAPPRGGDRERGRAMDKNQGYEILKAVMLENGRGFALGHNPRAVEPFVTWACYDDKVSGKREYEWGHYGCDYDAAFTDFLDRLRDYQQQFRVEVVQTEAPGLYKYYSTQRPVDIGTFPKGPGKKPDEIKNFDQRIPVEGGAFLAWGFLTYTRPLTEQDILDYELRPAPENPDLRRNGPRPIAEQLANAERLAQEHRRQAADGRTTADRDER